MLGLGNLGRRLLEAAVGLFALLGFLYVPLGRHTGFEHARAVFSTPAASAAIEDMTTSALRLRQRAVDFVTGRVSPPAPSPVGQTDQAPNHQPRGGGAEAGLGPADPRDRAPPTHEIVSPKLK